MPAIFQVMASGLPEDFPPLASLTPPTNIPQRLDPIVGRKHELGELKDLLGETGSRLVTIHGPGGAGKTRLAIAVAEELQHDFVDGTFFVDLTTSSAEGVVMMIADALGLSSELEANGGLEAAIGEKHMLLVLDNFEQAIDAANYVYNLIQSCSHLRVLVTSQLILRIRGEVEYPLSALGLPVDLTEQAVATSEAGQLFAAKGCARATWIRDRTRQRSSDRRRVPDAGRSAPRPRTGGSASQALLHHGAQGSARPRPESAGRGAARRPGPASDDPRHRGLELQPAVSPDQDVFRQFAVFTGGAELEAVEAVVDANVDPIERLTNLVEHSLIRRTDAGDISRFTMLQTIRAFALDLLATAEDEEAIRERHARLPP